MADSLTALGLTFETSQFSGGGYLDEIAVNNKSLPRFLALFEAALAEINITVQTTSSTALAIGTGTKIFTLDQDRPFVPGAYVVASDQADPGKRMHGDITAYDAANRLLTVNVGLVSGSGSASAWNVGLSGPAGPAGSGMSQLADDLTPDLSGPLECGGNEVRQGVFTNARGKLITANTGSAYTLDYSQANAYRLTLTDNCTFSLAAPPAGVAVGITVDLIQDVTGGRTITWPGSSVVKWPGGASPSLSLAASAVDLLFFWTTAAGAPWRGMAVLDFG